jgi:OmpA-OmpF porin, OOP family
VAGRGRFFRLKKTEPRIAPAIPGGRIASSRVTHRVRPQRFPQPQEAPMRWRTPTILALALLVGFGMPEPADAQIGTRIRDTARRAAERETLRQVDRQVTEAVRCVLTDQACIDKANAEGRDVQVVDTQGNPVAQPAGGGAAAAGQRVGEGAWANFDFVPGDRVLFAEDFGADRVGNFPRRLEFREGNLEIVEWEGGRYLRSTAEGSFDVVLPEALPERFTIEFDLYDPDFWPTEIYPVDGSRGYEDHSRVFFAFNNNSGLRGGGRTSTASTASMKLAPSERMMRVSMIADGPYLKVFLDETRVVNVPNVDLVRSNRVRIHVHGNGDRPVMIGNLRVAAGSTSLYDRLSTDGRVSTQGILFDTGSDRIRPESTPTLKEIGEMLRQHSSLRLRIEGHTDNVGQAAANQSLSERRAAAVKQHLVSSYGIDAGRVEAIGKGQMEPAASNETPEGRQNNRRVVLVRL